MDFSIILIRSASTTNDDRIQMCACCLMQRFLGYIKIYILVLIDRRFSRQHLTYEGFEWFSCSIYSIRWPIESYSIHKSFSLSICIRYKTTCVCLVIILICMFISSKKCFEFILNNMVEVVFLNASYTVVVVVLKSLYNNHCVVQWDAILRQSDFDVFD
jgi:hypothetical protein